MKVEVLQVENAKFRFKFSWWSNWVDVCTFNHGHSGYLLQMRVNRVNKKIFRCRSFQPFTMIHVTATEAGNLTYK